MNELTFIRILKRQLIKVVIYFKSLAVYIGRILINEWRSVINAGVSSQGTRAEGFDKYINHVDHVLWLLQSLDLNPPLHLWEILDLCVTRKPC